MYYNYATRKFLYMLQGVQVCRPFTRCVTCIYFTFHSYSPLPADGIILRPCPKDHEGDQNSSKSVGGGVAYSIVGGASIHDESFDDDFSDTEGSITDGSIGKHMY